MEIVNTNKLVEQVNCLFDLFVENISKVEKNDRFLLGDITKGTSGYEKHGTRFVAWVDGKAAAKVEGEVVEVGVSLQAEQVHRELPHFEVIVCYGFYTKEGHHEGGEFVEEKLFNHVSFSPDNFSIRPRWWDLDDDLDDELEDEWDEYP